MQDDEIEIIEGTLPAQDIDLDMTLLGGQSFLWHKEGDSYIGRFTDNIVWLSRNDAAIKYRIIGDNKLDINSLLGLNSAKIALQKVDDPIFMTAYKKLPGIHLMNQPFEETVIMFIVSSNNNIKRIRTIIQTMIEKYGEKSIFSNEKFFPTTERIASLSVSELESIGLGYRAKYIYDTSKILSSKKDLFDVLQSFNSVEKSSELQKLPGVGPKVADCILSFSGLDTSISPIDVWTRRLLSDLYGLDSNNKYDELRDWMKTQFEDNTAFVMQTLFEWYRTSGKNREKGTVKS